MKRRYLIPLLAFLALVGLFLGQKTASANFSQLLYPDELFRVSQVWGGMAFSVGYPSETFTIGDDGNGHANFSVYVENKSATPISGAGTTLSIYKDGQL